MSENRYRLGIDEIQKYLPHRSPFLLVDRILEIHSQGSDDVLTGEEKIGTKVIGLKNVSFNEPYFTGHFPGFAILPGVLIIETMAQISSFALYPYMARDLGKLAREFQCILIGVDGARFRKPVVPGDQLRIESTVTKCRGKIWGFDCVATVDGNRVAEAQLLANLASGADRI